MNIEDIVSIFCQERCISTTVLYGTERRNNIWITRYMIWHYLHYDCKMSASKLSKHFKRNVPSIFRGIRIMKHELKYNKWLRTQYHSIIEVIEDATNAAPSKDIMEEKD